MSANAPILNLILSEIQGMKKDISEIKEDVKVLKLDVNTLKINVSTLRVDLNTLTNDFHEFKTNVILDKHKMIKIQEKSDAEFFRQHLDTIIPSAMIDSYNFGDFYDIDGRIITDIDGCVTLHTIPTIPNTSIYKLNNSKQFKTEMIRNEIFILESKTSLDRVLLDKKLAQFIKINHIVKNIKTLSKSQSEQFQSMITSYPLSRHPNKVYFILCANDMSITIRNFIKEINEGSLDEEKYKYLSFKMFVEHPNYKLFLSIVKDKPKLSNKYKQCTTFDEMRDFLQGGLFEKHRVFINNYFCAYKRAQYDKMRGLLGYVFQGTVYLPTSF